MHCFFFFCNDSFLINYKFITIIFFITDVILRFFSIVLLNFELQPSWLHFTVHLSKRKNLLHFFFVSFVSIRDVMMEFFHACNVKIYSMKFNINYLSKFIGVGTECFLTWCHSIFDLLFFYCEKVLWYFARTSFFISSKRTNNIMK